jgi:phage I-like protein
MNPLRHIIRQIQTLISAANDATEITIANGLGDSAAVFQVAQGDSFFVPYGRYPHKVGLQIFDRASAEAMQAAANSTLTRAAGIPVYIGHPDVPGRADSNPSAPAVGWIDSVEIGEDGATFRHRMNPRGQSAIANAEYRYYSPHWLLDKVPGGLSPRRLLSIGLTNNPLIPVPAIANDQPTQNQMNEQLLIALGLAADATLEAATARIAELTTAANDLATAQQRVTELDNQLTAANDTLSTERTRAEGLTSQLTTAQDRVTELEGQLTAANDATTSARALAIDTSIERAVLAGRLSQADSATRRTELIAIANDSELATRLREIETAAVTLPGSGTATGDLSGARASAAAENDATARAVQRQQAIDAELVSIANDAAYTQSSKATRHDLAWQRAARKHPTLFTSAQASA